jgi:hypothetical protein
MQVALTIPVMFCDMRTKFFLHEIVKKLDAKQHVQQDCSALLISNLSNINIARDLAYDIVSEGILITFANIDKK